MRFKLSEKILSRRSLYLNQTDDNITCFTPHYITSFQEFSTCYELFFKLEPSLALFEISLFVSTVIANLLVCVLLIMKKRENKISVFDKVIIGHALVDGLTGLIDMPLFHFQSIFGYSPLPYFLSQLWAVYDNNINMVTSLHMLYMSYVRLRSLDSPKNYNLELLIKYPIIIMACFWLCGLATWAPIVFSLGLEDYTLILPSQYSLVTTIVIFITWFTPLVLIFGVSSRVVYILQKRNSAKNKISTKKRKHTANHSENTALGTTTNVATGQKVWNRRLFRVCFNYRFTAHTKFIIIISTYWVQWIIPCVVILLNGICESCISSDKEIYIYWLTYTVCLVDPIIVLLLNPNVSCMRH